MPTRRFDRHDVRTTRSWLGESLVRLERELGRTNRQARHVASLLEQWERQWRWRRREIAARLELIERHLQAFEHLAADSSPKLTVVGTPADAHRMTVLG